MMGFLKGEEQDTYSFMIKLLPPAVLWGRLQRRIWTYLPAYLGTYLPKVSSFCRKAVAAQWCMG